jgi:hypothetical protein
VIVCSDIGALFFAGIFNPTFTTYRMNATEDTFMARVTSSWSISSKSVQSVFIVIGGLLSLILGIRGSLAVAGALCLLSLPLLPWGDALSAAPGDADRHRDVAAGGDREPRGVGRPGRR